jgi:hypothetical protein
MTCSYSANTPAFSALVDLTDAHATLYIHEIAMHFEHDIDDFKPPFSMTPTDANPQLSHRLYTPSHISLLTICLHSIHRIFDTFLSVEPVQLRNFPCVVFVRILYAGIAFLKLSTIATPTYRSPSSLFTADQLRTEYYFDKLVAALAETSNHGKYRSIGEFWEQVSMMKLWWLTTRPTRNPRQEYEPSSSTPIVSSNPPSDIDVLSTGLSASSAPVETSISADLRQEDLPNRFQNFQTQRNQDDYTFGLDLDMDLRTFDMLGQFDNGMTSFWPNWN